MGRKYNTIVLALLLGLPASVAAQAPADTFRLADAVALAREANPMLQAARLRADVSEQRVPQSGAWPDPQLSFGLLNRPVTDLGNTDQPMTMNSVSLMQRFRWPGKLGFAEDRAEYPESEQWCEVTAGCENRRVQENECDPRNKRREESNGKHSQKNT